MRNAMLEPGSSPPALVPPAFSSLASGAYETILQGIMTGALPAGSQLSIDGLAKQLRMSNTPVREALSRLAAERLVTQSANRGYTIAQPVTPEEFHHLFTARTALEVAAAETARLGPDAVSEVAKVMRHFFGAKGSREYRDYRNFNLADRELHLALVRVSRNKFLAHAWAQLHFHLHVGRLYASAGVIDFDEARAEHDAIFRALEAKDRKALTKRIAEHSRRAEQRLSRLLVEPPDRPPARPS